MAKTRAHIYVGGKVQGVYFRQHTKRQAQIQGATGWVRNLEDGRVEAVFEGEEEAVRAMVEYCRHGPQSASVTAFEVSWEPYRGEFAGFEVAY
ncbi:MAG: acylphosphatase [Candidatus Bathyarchaeota archaeon]|nr:acylphosphatase [Candidatus Bathyarchaeota archaeon]